MKVFPNKAPTETRVLTLCFTLDLASGETLTGTPTVTIGQYSGATDPNINSMLIGAPQLSGANVMQNCTAGMNGTVYYIEASCQTSLGETIACGGLLPVVNSWLQ